MTEGLGKTPLELYPPRVSENLSRVRDGPGYGGHNPLAARCLLDDGSPPALAPPGGVPAPAAGRTGAAPVSS